MRTDDPPWRSIGGVLECDGHHHAWCMIAPVVLAHPTRYRVFLGPPTLYAADALASSILMGNALWDMMKLRPTVAPVLVGWSCEDLDDPTPMLGADVAAAAVRAVHAVELREITDGVNAPGGTA